MGNQPEDSDEALPALEPASQAEPEISAPSPNPSTNLLIADIVLRGASTLFRRDVERRIATASTGDDDAARKMVDGRTILTTLALHGASKLATRSVPGLLLVSGGLIAKTLYDRGKVRQQREREAGLGAVDEQTGDARP